jgi:hypothetical protein
MVVSRLVDHLLWPCRSIEPRSRDSIPFSPHYDIHAELFTYMVIINLITTTALINVAQSELPLSKHCTDLH